MIIKFTKTLNPRKEYDIVEMDESDSMVDTSKFNNCIYETSSNYYFYTDKIININGDFEKFKILAKKGDIVSLTARDNSYLVFPSKKMFSIAFNLDYASVLQYQYQEVLFDQKPFVVRYVKDKDDKINDGVVYTLSQLCTYVSSLIKGYVQRETRLLTDNQEDSISRVVNKYYNSRNIVSVSPQYELNVMKISNDGEFKKGEIINLSKSNRFLYDYWLIHMFAYMILAKSKRDEERDAEPIYRFNRSFDNIDEVLKFLEENQDIVNNFFIESNILFNDPNSMYSAYAPHINGVYMFYEYNNVKCYVYRNVDKQYFNDKLLMPTYVTTSYRLNIKKIKKFIQHTNEYPSLSI